MKLKNFTHTISLLLIFSNSIFSQTDIVKFSCDNHLEISTENAIFQSFTMPAGSNYYITEMGMQIEAASQSGNVYFGIYEYKSSPTNGWYLLFRTKEVEFTGGADKIVSVAVSPGVQKLEAGKTYLAALIYSGANYLHIKIKVGASNNGIATNLTSATFKTGVSYPRFPNPLTPSGSWGFNLGLIVKGVNITTPITPKDEILDFNCTNYQELQTGLLIYDQITLPTGDDLELRHIGIKTDASTANGPVKLAIYDNANPGPNILYVSDELIISGSGIDTSYVVVPSSTLTLAAGEKYNIAMQYGGTGYLHVLNAVNPVSKGIASINNYTIFKTGLTYPTFPDPLPSQGSWGSTIGFVLNGDEPVATKIDRNNSVVNNIRVFPTVTDNNIWLYSDNKIVDGTKVDIYNITGQKVKSFIWKESNTIDIDVSGLYSGTYLIKVNNKKNLNQTIKFIKK